MSAIRPRDGKAVLISRPLVGAVDVDADTRTTDDLRAENRALKQLSLAQERLVEQVLVGGGVVALVQTLARLVGRPVALVRSESVIASGPTGELSVEIDLDLPHVAVPVSLSGGVLGYLLVPGVVELPTLTDRMILDCAGRFFALFLHREKSALEAARRNRGQLLGEIFSGVIHDDDTLAARGIAHGCDLVMPGHLLVAEAHGEVIGDDLAEAVSAALDENRLLVTCWDGRIVVLVPRATTGQKSASTKRKQIDDTLANRLCSTLKRLRPGCSVSVITSAECSRVSDVLSQYAESVAILAICHRLGRGGAVIQADDPELGLYRFLIGSHGEVAIRQFVGGVLESLDAYDTRRHAQLLETLEAFLEHNGNIAATASACHVHLNTLKYRLGKIVEISGLSLHNPDDRLRAHLALKLRRLATSSSFGRIS